MLLYQASYRLSLFFSVMSFLNFTLYSRHKLRIFNCETLLWFLCLDLDQLPYNIFNHLVMTVSGSPLLSGALVLWAGACTTLHAERCSTCVEHVNRWLTLLKPAQAKRELRTWEGVSCEREILHLGSIPPRDNKPQMVTQHSVIPFLSVAIETKSIQRHTWMILLPNILKF